MNARIRIPLYIVLVILAGISGYYAFSSFGKMMDRAADRTTDLEQIEPERKPPAEEAAPAPGPSAITNGPAPELGTNAAAVTGALSILTNSGTDTATNAVAATEPVAPPPAEKTEEVPTALTPTSASGTGQGTAKSGGRLGLWFAVFIVSIILLGLLIANDISAFMSSRTLQAVFNDEGKGQENPEYDQAEQVWANGQHLEAIGLMRDYLKKNPREQHVALRIAEIYEKDLGNHLAAALEYEEVLKHKLPPDRWGWAAIHLCNLYFKLGQEEKGYALLRRLVKEHPQTPAAEKARKRLQQVDGAVVEQIATESNVKVAARTVAPKEEAGPASNLPPGFRPKK